MAQSVFQNSQGVIWPLGFIQVVTSGVPVGIMSLVDPTGMFSPESAIGAPYTPRAHKVWISGFKPGANSTGMVANTGNIYVMQGPGPNNQQSGGSGNLTDYGAMLAVISPGAFFQLPDQTISPYRYYLDADFSGDGALCQLVGSER